MNKEYIRPIGVKGIYQFFHIYAFNLPDGMNHIVLKHNGDWISEWGLMRWREYDTYEDIQKTLGSGLIFVTKNYTMENNQSIITYSSCDILALLAVPFTIGETNLEIYASDGDNCTLLLYNQKSEEDDWSLNMNKHYLNMEFNKRQFTNALFEKLKGAPFLDGCYVDSKNSISIADFKVCPVCGVDLIRIRAEDWHCEYTVSVCCNCGYQNNELTKIS